MTQTLLFAMVASAWGLQSPHRDAAFLSAKGELDGADWGWEGFADSPEGVGPNLHFAPISTTMKCTISLIIQYMVVYTALGICRSYLDFQAQPYDGSALQKALRHASETVFYAPMSCLLFVAFRMRVLQLTKGQGNPQDYVQMAMQGVTYSILANTIMVMIIPLFSKTGEQIELEEGTGEPTVDGKNPFESKLLEVSFTVIRYICFLALYVGFGAVVYGLFTFTPDPNIWQGPVPPVSPAVFCTCILACAFFAIYCLLAVSRTYTQMTAGTRKTTKFEEVMRGAADTLAMAPMLCVLFLGARMRALQMDPIGGNPQAWAQNCFYACTWALLAQCGLAVAVPLVLRDMFAVEGLKVSKTDTDGKALPEGDVRIEGQGILGTVLSVARWVIMLGVYVGGIAVVCSVFTIEHPKGKEYTPAVSPTMQCVINLAFQYFFIYSTVWIFYTVKHFTQWGGLDHVSDCIESAKSTVQFAPMLSVLFIATRMRALQITENRGSPQGYVQDGMYLATWSLVVQFLMCLIMPFFTGKKYAVPDLAGRSVAGGKVLADAEKVEPANVDNYYAAVLVTSIRYAALLSLLGGVTAVITGVFLMDPTNANGRGSLPLVGEHLSAPPSATDVPYVEEGMQATGPAIGGGVDAVQGAADGAAGAVGA